MKVIGFNGSPRKEWNTATMLKSALEGAASKGAKTELVHLYDLDFKGCTSCFACKLKGGKSYGRCAMRDDLTPFLKEVETADGIILGCPTYYGTLPGKMKAVIDDWSWKMKVDFTDKVGGAFSTGGGQVGGKEFVVMSLVMFMLSNRMVVAGPLYRNDKTGSVWGEVGAAAMTGPLDPGVSVGELDSARRLGERVARLAVKLKTTRTPAQEQK